MNASFWTFCIKPKILCGLCISRVTTPYLFSTIERNANSDIIRKFYKEEKIEYYGWEKL